MKLEDFKCDACGGRVKFNAEKQNLICEYCGTEYDIEDANSEGIKTEETHDRIVETLQDEEGNTFEFEKEIWNEGNEDLTVYSCNSCGGEIIGDKTVASTSCPFCDNNVVIPGQFHGDLKPDFVLPFKKTKQEAKNALLRFYEGRKLLPKVFKDENQIDEIKGIYVPFWLYSGTSDAKISFDAAKIRYYSDSEYEYVETNNYDVHREGNVEFQYVPVDGSSKLDNIMMESVEPFEWEELKDFNSQYLAGYLANRYDVDAKDCIDDAKERIRNTTIDIFKNSVIGYDRIQVRAIEYSLGKTNIKYALVPIWFLNTKFRGKYYSFAMNGQTGKVIGDDMPIDNKLLLKEFLINLLIFAAIAFVIVSAFMYFDF